MVSALSQLTESVRLREVSVGVGSVPYGVNQFRTMSVRGRIEFSIGV